MGSSFGRPSMVRISWLLASIASIMQDKMALPSMITVQAPQPPSSHETLSPVYPNFSLNKKERVIVGVMSRSSSKLCQLPLIFILISDGCPATVFLGPLDDLGIARPL